MTARRPPEPITDRAPAPGSSWMPVNLDQVLAECTPEKTADRERQLEDLVGDAVSFLEPHELICPCGAVADAIHCLPTFGHAWPEAATMAIVAACGVWDPGGYWIRLERFWGDPEDWCRHLARKNRSSFEQLVEWLVDQEQDQAPAILPESGPVAHAGNLLFSAGAPVGPRGERDLQVVDAIRRRTLYSGRVDLNWPAARQALAKLLGQPDLEAVVRRTEVALRRQRVTEADVDRIADELAEAARSTYWLEVVNEGFNALAMRQAPSAVGGGILLSELESE